MKFRIVFVHVIIGFCVVHDIIGFCVVHDIISCCVDPGDRKDVLDSPVKEDMMWNANIMNNLTEEEGGSLIKNMKKLRKVSSMFRSMQMKQVFFRQDDVSNFDARQICSNKNN